MQIHVNAYLGFPVLSKKMPQIPHYHKALLFACQGMVARERFERCLLVMSQMSYLCSTRAVYTRRVFRCDALPIELLGGGVSTKMGFEPISFCFHDSKLNICCTHLKSGFVDFSAKTENLQASGFYSLGLPYDNLTASF